MNAEQRAAVLVEAQSWIGTPFAHQQRLKGVGADCAQWIDAVYGVVLGWPYHDFGNYPRGWMLHADKELYRGWAESLCDLVAEPQAGDLALFRFGRMYSHGAIVVEWPEVIHADPHAHRIWKTSAMQPPLARRDVLFFSPKTAALAESQP